MYELFIEPLTYGFMQRGLLVTVLAALVCALLSCWLVLMGWSLMGDGISHAVLPGVALAYILGAPFALGALIAALVAVALIGSVAARGRVREDAAIVMFALGLVLLSAFPSQVDLHSVIFGNVLGVSWVDVWQIGLLAVLVVAVLLMKRRDLVLYAFDPGYTHAIGLNPKLLSGLLLVALALTSVLALQIVGVVLVVALLVIPGATARLLTDRFTTMLLISAGVSLIAALAGFFMGYLLDVSAGGTVVLALGVLFGLAYLFAPRHGLLALTRAKRAAAS